MSYKLTNQQQAIIDALKSKEHPLILVDAVSGSGKTSTSQAAVDAIKPVRGLYTAFNKAIVQEGLEKFSTNMECKTMHALALKYTKPKKGIEDFTYLCIKEQLSYADKRIIISSMDEFFRSHYTDMYQFFDDYLPDSPVLGKICIQYIEQMLNDKIPVTFNFLLKYFHLLLHEGQIESGYDFVILDEIQDSTGVALEIFQLLDAPHKLGLGDQDQSIYGFMNLVNGFEVLLDAHTLPLTKSFRCSENIAKRVDKFGKENLHKSFEFIGTDAPYPDGLTAYITATNAQIIYRLNKLHKEGKGYILTRPIKDIFACPLALITAQSGKEVYHKKYKFLEKEYKQYTLSNYKSFFSYLKAEVDDVEIKNSINLLMRFKAENINIFDVLKDAKAVRRDSSITVGTGFSLKGLGYETVFIEEDLNLSVGDILNQGGPENEEEKTLLKLYYVACTRARINLYGANHL